MSKSNWLMEHLVCPRDKKPLISRDSMVECQHGHQYKVFDGVPVMLISEGNKTHWSIEASLKTTDADAPWFTSSINLSPEQIRDLSARANDKIDPIVSYAVAATNGIAYKGLVGSRLEEYPIPEIRLPPGDGRRLLDVGCNWGRWSNAAARLGYQVVGIDPSLGSVMAARRVAKTLGHDIAFVCGDARSLPFPDGTFDIVYSNGVLQHFSRENARRAVSEIGRVTRPGGASLVQMAAKWGIRGLYHQAKRGFTDGKDFDVRYWTLGDLSRVFEDHVGPSRISVDCFFGLGLQPSDLHLMPPIAKAATLASEILRKTSKIIPPLRYAADSVYVSSRKS
jgi:SAM-dependent methyltransferase/uncharacterized protein YbaR (Trm112 family)